MASAAAGLTPHRPALSVRCQWVYGAIPQGGLALGPDGAIYATTTGGGPAEQGTVFRIVP
jgi:hypothetical protein